MKETSTKIPRSEFLGYLAKLGCAIFVPPLLQGCSPQNTGSQNTNTQTPKPEQNLEQRTEKWINWQPEIVLTAHEPVSYGAEVPVPKGIKFSKRQKIYAENNNFGILKLYACDNEKKTMRDLNLRCASLEGMLKHITPYAASADCKKIVYISLEKDAPHLSVYLADLQNSTVSHIAKVSYTGGIGNDEKSLVAISPDGTKLAFTGVKTSGRFRKTGNKWAQVSDTIREDPRSVYLLELSTGIMSEIGTGHSPSFGSDGLLRYAGPNGKVVHRN